MNLPISMIEKIRVLQGEIKTRVHSTDLKVAWVPAPNMHVTVKFLGDIPEESALAISDRLRVVLEGRGAMTLDVGQLGVFPDLQHPRVLWVGVTAPALEQLAQTIDETLEPLGFEPESRPYHPHLTLGRVKHGSAPELYDGLEPALGQCSLHEVVLYKSVLQRTGAEYTALARLPLTPRWVAGAP